MQKMIRRFLTVVSIVAACVVTLSEQQMLRHPLRPPVWALASEFLRVGAGQARVPRCLSAARPIDRGQILFLARLSSVDDGRPASSGD